MNPINRLQVAAYGLFHFPPAFAMGLSQKFDLGSQLKQIRIDPGNIVCAWPEAEGKNRMSLWGSSLEKVAIKRSLKHAHSPTCHAQP